MAGTAVIAAVTLLLVLPGPSIATTPPGGNGRIVYELGSELGLMASNGSGQHELTATPSAGEGLPTWSPTGRRIAFWRSVSGGQDDVWLISPSGSDDDQVTDTAAPITEFASAFTPDGRRLLFSRSEPSQIDIWATQPIGAPPFRLTNTSARNEYVNDVSPDGRAVIYSRVNPAVGFDTFDIWSMRANGTNQHDLTNSPGLVERFASFSPNGRLIVFDRCSANGAECDLWLMNANGGAQRPLVVTTGIRERHPAFSPNGLRVLFTRCASPDPCDLATVDLNGGSLDNLTESNPAGEAVPDWESIQRCGGRRATIVGDDGPDKIRGTRRRDVIDANGGQDVIRGRGGGDLICGGKGPDRLLGGKGRDRLFGGKGRDGLRGGPGLDKLRGGPGRDLQAQ